MQPPTRCNLAQVQAEARRRSLVRFVSDSQRGYMAGWVHRDICSHLEAFSAAVAEGRSPRLMLSMPPQHGKSFIASERWPVWHLGKHPEHRIGVASYAQDLSTAFSVRARDLAAEYGVATFPATLEMKPGRKTMESWETTAGGGYKAVGVGSALTGHGVHILIVDDPHKDMQDAMSETARERVKEWYRSTAYTRLRPGGGILIIQTRWHEDDLSGWLLAEAQASSSADQWQVIRYPAIAEVDEAHRKAGEALHPERYTLDHYRPLMRFKSTWEALYQQRPTVAAGNLFRWEWARFYDLAPARFDEVVQSWDCAFKDADDSDYVVGQVWGRRGGEFYLLDQVRGHLGMPATVEAILAMRAKWTKARAILVEDKANGPAVMQALRGKVPGLIAVNPEGGKVARAHAVAPFFEAGNVYLPRAASWLNDYMHELTSFPRLKHDDQVDATTQALIRFGKPKAGVTTIAQLQAIASRR